MGTYMEGVADPRKMSLLPIEAWNNAIRYTTTSLVYDRGGYWVAVATNTASRPVSGNTNWILVSGTPYVAKTLTPAQIRTLNSVPINLVVPANATTFLAPGQVLFVGEQGSGAYSAAPAPSIQYSDATLALGLDPFPSWDGSATKLVVTPDVLVASSPLLQVWTPQIGLTLQITSAGDVTGGDAPCTIICKYLPYDLTTPLSTMSFFITSINQSTKTFSVAPSPVVAVSVGAVVTVTGDADNTANNGTYHVLAVTSTTIRVREVIPSSTAGAWLSV